jgi:type VI protein secretion system component Hcp
MRGMTFGRGFGILATAVVLSGLGLGAGCDGSPGSGDAELAGRAQLALMGVPADGTCIQVTAAGYRTVTRTFSVTAGATALLDLGGLPLGTVTFSAAASGGDCPAPAGTVATWVSDAPFTTTIGVDPPALVTLNLVRNGNASVSIGFDDGAMAGSGGLAGSSGAAGAAGAGDSTGAAGSAGGAGASAGSFGGSVFMQIPGVQGGSVLKGFENWFVLDSFTLASNTPASAAGGGGGASKTTFTATAKLAYQKGVPELYGVATKGTVEKTITLVTRSGGAMPATIWKATLGNAVVSGVAADATTAGQTAPELTVSLAFGSLDLEYDPQNADGSAGAPIHDVFDLARNTGPTAPSPAVPMSFVVGGDVRGLVTATAFRAPSEMTAGSPAGGGGGAGKPVFSDASLTVPLDGAALGFLAEEFTGRITATASVQLATRSADGSAATLGTYGFQNVSIHSMTFSGATATMSFGATAFKWSQGAVTVTFP